MNKTIYVSFIKDVHNLYCKTSRRDVEKIFIKLAQAYEDNLSKFLNSTEARTSIKGSLHNPELLDVLSMLTYIKSQHPENFTVSDAARFFIGDRKKSHYIPFVVALRGLLNDPDVESILSPFDNIINGCQSFQVDVSHINYLKEDLLTIKTGFIGYVEKEQAPITTYPRKLTKKQKTINLFSFLLKQFTNEVSSAANSLGLSELSKKISSEALLAKPDQLFVNLQFGIYSPQMRVVGERISREVLKNIDIEYRNYNYNLIRNTAMQYAGMMSSQDFNSFLLSQMNAEEFLKDDDEIVSTIKQDTEKFLFSPEQIINPSSLMIISFALYDIYTKAR